MENVGWSFPTIEDIFLKNSHEVMLRNKKMKKNWNEMKKICMVLIITRSWPIWI
jgi:hypothetical protein